MPWLFRKDQSMRKDNQHQVKRTFAECGELNREPGAKGELHRTARPRGRQEATDGTNKITHFQKNIKSTGKKGYAPAVGSMTNNIGYALGAGVEVATHCLAATLLEVKRRVGRRRSSAAISSSAASIPLASGTRRAVSSVAKSVAAHRSTAVVVKIGVVIVVGFSIGVAAPTATATTIFVPPCGGALRVVFWLGVPDHHVLHLGLVPLRFPHL